MKSYSVDLVDGRLLGATFKHTGGSNEGPVMDINRSIKGVTNVSIKNGSIKNEKKTNKPTATQQRNGGGGGRLFGNIGKRLRNKNSNDDAKVDTK